MPASHMKVTIYRRQITALVRSKHHDATLTRLISEHRIPKGLAIKRLPINLPDIPVDIKICWEDAHLEFSRSIMRILLSYWSTRTRKLQTEIAELRASFEPKCSEPEQQLIKHLITLAESQEELRLLEKDANPPPPASS